MDDGPDSVWSGREKECSRVETLNTALLGKHSQNDAEMWLGSGNFPSVHIRHLFEPYPAIHGRAREIPKQCDRRCRFRGTALNRPGGSDHSFVTMPP